MVGFCHGGNLLDNQEFEEDGEDDEYGGKDVDDDGYPANPHHDKIPPWGEFVINGHGGILSSAYSHHGYS